MDVLLISGLRRAMLLGVVGALVLLPLRISAQEITELESSDTSEFDHFNFDSIPIESSHFLRSVKVNGQVRFRSEINRRRPLVPGGEEMYDFHLLRTRLAVTIMPHHNVTGMVQAQDSRTFGSSGSTLGVDPNAFDLHQAWLRVNNFLADDLSLTLGRQEFSYGNERLIGAVGWHNRGRVFDAVKLRTEHQWGSIDLFASRTNDRVGLTSGDENLVGLWGALKPSDRQSLDLFALYDTDNAKLELGPDSGSDVRNRGTYGVRWLGTLSALTFELEGAYQNGEQSLLSDPSDSNDIASISAYLASARASLRLGKTDIGLLYTRLSGDDDPVDAEINTFNTLFATNHKFYGYMDYFPGVVSGLQDVALLLGLRAGKKTSFSLDGHYFLPAVSGDPYGMEVDLTATHHYNEAVTMIAGASVFLPDDGFAGVLGEENGYWGYLMVNVGL